MDRDDDGETSYKYNTFVDDVAFEPTYLQAIPTAAGRNVATLEQEKVEREKQRELEQARLEQEKRDREQEKVEREQQRQLEQARLEQERKNDS